MLDAIFWILVANLCAICLGNIRIFYIEEFLRTQTAERVRTESLKVRRNS